MTNCPTCGAETDGGILWGFDSQILVKDGVIIHLSPYETEMLRILKGGEITGTALDWAIFKSLAVNASQVVKVTLHRLRKKVAPFDIEIACKGATKNGREHTVYSMKVRGG